MHEPEPGRRYRFGVFEADAVTGELRRQGIRIRLHVQPFQLLLLLLEKPGELVTREEIVGVLWPDGTFVDSEHGVNSAVNRLREALGDQASAPRFVETLARRGYRFVAPVERIELEERAAETAPANETVAPSMLDGILAGPEDLPRIPQKIVLILLSMLQLMYLAFYVAALANLAEIEELLSALPRAGFLLDVLIGTAAVLIPVRAFVLCAALFRAPGFHGKLLKIWPGLLVADVGWALSPFLLLHHINLGLALACTALLVYSPFAQRSLVLMNAGEPRKKV